MMLRFFGFLVVAGILVLGCGFAYLALVDVPVPQQEITVNVPLSIN